MEDYKEHEPRALGDNIQKWGSSLILIESGGYKDDKEKQFIRQFYFNQRHTKRQYQNIYNLLIIKKIPPQYKIEKRLIRQLEQGVFYY